MVRPVTRRQFLGGAAFVAAGAALEACLPTATTVEPATTAAPSADPAFTPFGDPWSDVVLRNATVLTMDASRPAADTVVIRGDTIIAVGAEAEVMADLAPNARIIDVGGRVLLPGFNDAHCHRIGDREVAGYESAEDAIEDALEAGWTSISELFVNEERLDELRALDDAGRLRLRVNAYLPVNYLDDKFGTWFDAYQPRQVFSPRLRIGGIKIFADSAGIHEMYMTQPHIDTPGHKGDVFWTPDEFADLVRGLHDDGWQLATHTAGDAAHDMVLDAYEAALAGASNVDHRHRIEHVMAIRDDQVQRMADLAIVASFQLTWFTADTTRDVEGTLDAERLPWVGRWRDLLDAGVVAVASTDHPWDYLVEAHGVDGAAMAVLGVAVTRSAAPGATPEAWQIDQAISVEQGLDLMTRAGAYATLEDDRKGTITPGKLADLVVLSDDPRVVPPEALREVKVLMTMVGGRVQYCALGAPGLCPSSP
jgi:predicted amidohydrolase YtcJ